MIGLFGMLCMSLFLSVTAQDNSLEELDIMQSFEQREPDFADYDAIPALKPIKPVPVWQQWVTSLADMLMTQYDELQHTIKQWYSSSTQWIALQLQNLRQRTIPRK